MSKNEERETFTIENHGQKIFGIIHRPLNISNAPAVIFCQGFEGNKCGKLNIYVSLAQELAKRGFLVVRFDYRGSGDSEGDSKLMTIEDKVSDTLSVLEYISKDNEVDSKRLAIFGRSLGGAIATLAAHESSNVRSLVLWAPVFNGNQWKELWVKSLQKTSDANDKAEIKKIPGEIPNEEFLKQLFSLNLGDKLPSLQSIPILHIHGEKDSIVKLEHADAFKAACKNFKISKFIRLPNTDHDFALSEDKTIAIDETIEWFKNTL